MFVDVDVDENFLCPAISMEMIIIIVIIIIVVIVRRKISTRMMEMMERTRRISKEGVLWNWSQAALLEARSGRPMQRLVEATRRRTTAACLRRRIKRLMPCHL